MPEVLSPSMNLPVPTVGFTPGPEYASAVNQCMSVIDQHSHQPGSGVQITPAGLNINSALTFQANFATNFAGATFSAQASTPANGTIFQDSSGFLRYIDLNTGTNIQITNSSGVAGSPGSISNLTSPASASYVSGSSTFVWQSGSNVAANMDFGSAIMRNLSPNSTFALTLGPPTGLSSNYSVQLPASNTSGSTQFLGLDTSNNIVQIASTTNGITRSNLAAVGQQVSSSTGTGQTIQSGTFTAFTNLHVTITTTGRPVMLIIQGDASGNPSVLSASNTAGNFANFAFFRGSTQLGSYELSIPTGITQVETQSLVYLDTPSAGTYTYTLQAQTNSNSVGFASAVHNVLVAYEL